MIWLSGTYNANPCKAPRFSFKIFCSRLSRLKRIFKQAGQVARIRGDRTMALESWYNSNKNVVAIGEAAHGWNVCARTLLDLSVRSHGAILAWKHAYSRVWRGRRRCSGAITIKIEAQERSRPLPVCVPGHPSTTM